MWISNKTLCLSTVNNSYAHFYFESKKKIQVLRQLYICMSYFTKCLWVDENHKHVNKALAPLVLVSNLFCKLEYFQFFAKSAGDKEKFFISIVSFCQSGLR